MSRSYRFLSNEVFEAFQGTFDPETQLARMARTLGQEFGADLCVICFPSGDQDGFQLQGTFGEEDLWPRGAVRNGCLTGQPEEGSPLLMGRRKGYAPPPEGAGFASALLYPISWRGRSAGVALFAYRTRGKVPRRVLRTMEALSGTLASLIRGSLTRLYQTRKNELAGEILRISELLSSAGSVQACYSTMARSASQLTGAGGAVIRTFQGKGLGTRAFYAREISGFQSIERSNDLVHAEKAFHTGRSIIVNSADGEEFAQGGPVSRNLLCVPFKDPTGWGGVLTLFDRRTGSLPLPFGRLERETARALVRVGLLATYHIGKETEVRKISRSLENRVRELTLLHQISRAVLDRKDVNDVLRSLLEAVTNVEGFGFDRAFLFLYDEENTVLRGMLGVEAFPALPGGNAGGDGLQRGVRHAELDEVIADHVLPVTANGGVVSRTVLENRSFRIRLPRHRDLVSEEEIRHLGGVSSFATVPLVSEGRAIGVIWVDNHRTVRPIGSEDFQLLVSAAAQAGLAVERSFQAQALDVLNSQLMDLQTRMILWEKMAALGEMAASVAHDIRNPLVSIGGFTRRLRKLLPDEGKGPRYADIIIQEVDRLERTLDNVMSYSRRYSLVEKKTTSLYGLLSECAELFRENFKKKGIGLIRHFGPDLPEILLDERQIKQALLNVLFNAGEAADADSEIRFEAALENGRKSIVISVTDDGGGIDPENMEKIFQPFFTTKGTGTGLGLTIAQRAISGHGGEIRVDNRHGEGVTFKICLPTNLDVDGTGEK